MRLVTLLACLLFLSCSSTTEPDTTTPPTAISIKGKVPQSRTLPTITHVAAIPISDTYSPASIVKNLTPIQILEDGSFNIEGIDTDIIIVLLNQTTEKTTVVDLVALQQNGETLHLLPLGGVEPQEFDLGTLNISENSSAISSLLPSEMIDSLSSSEILEIATLDDVYKNIENHINNSQSSSQSTEKQVFYIKPEVAFRNSLKDLYIGTTAENAVNQANIDYHLLQFSTLPIEIPVTEIGGNFTIQSPSGVSYTCPALTKQGGVVDEGSIYVRRYTANSDPASFLIEYVWDNESDANAENSNHIGNVNFFGIDQATGYWIPEKGAWNYSWKGETYGTFDVAFAQPFNDQNQFEGYIPVPTITKSPDGTLTNVSVNWYHAHEGTITAVGNMDIAKDLITRFDVEVSTQQYLNGQFQEQSIHLNNSDFTGTTIPEELILINSTLINDDSDVTDSHLLQDGKKYVEALFLMYDLGNELTYTFVWNLNIK